MVGKFVVIKQQPDYRSLCGGELRSGDVSAVSTLSVTLAFTCAYISDNIEGSVGSPTHTTAVMQLSQLGTLNNVFRFLGYTALYSYRLQTTYCDWLHFSQRCSTFHQSLNETPVGKGSNILHSVHLPAITTVMQRRTNHGGRMKSRDVSKCQVSHSKVNKKTKPKTRLWFVTLPNLRSSNNSYKTDLSFG